MGDHEPDGTMKIPDAPKIPVKGRISTTFTWLPVAHGMDVVLRARKLEEMMGEDVAYALCDAMLVACLNYDLDPVEVFHKSLDTMNDTTTQLIEEDEPDANTQGPHGGFMP